MNKCHSQLFAAVEVTNLLTLDTPCPPAVYSALLDTRPVTHPSPPTSLLLGQPVTVVRIHKLSAAETAVGRTAGCLDQPRPLYAGSAKLRICLLWENREEGRYLLDRLYNCFQNKVDTGYAVAP